jgi:hypothetical protein
VLERKRAVIEAALQRARARRAGNGTTATVHDDRRRHRAFFATLAAANPHPQTELEFTSVFELLAAVLLSAQATDVSVNKATRSLFALAPRRRPCWTSAWTA